MIRLIFIFLMLTGTGCKWSKKKQLPPKDVTPQEETLVEFKKAVESVVLTDPQAIKEFPDELRFILAREKCKIPHASNDPNKLGWITGHFYKSTQTDFAVLCMTPQKEMTIKVFWGKERPCSISLGYGMSKKYVVPKGDDAFSYSRTLLKAGPERLTYYAYHAKLKKPYPNQEGIEDTVLGKGSTVYYCLDGKWQAIPVAPK